jgi:hypothetical protein
VLAYGLLVPRIDAHVDHAASLTPTFVNVTVEQPFARVGRSLLDVSIVIVAVAAVREVAGKKRTAADWHAFLSLMYLGETGLEVALGPSVGATAMTGPATVVIAGDEMLATMQRSDQREHLVDTTEGNITEHPHGVVGLYVGIPSVGQSRVHFVNIDKRPTGIANDIGVTEVEIRSEPRRHALILADSGDVGWGVSAS